MDQISGAIQKVDAIRLYGKRKTAMLAAEMARSAAWC